MDTALPGVGGGRIAGAVADARTVSVGGQRGGTGQDCGDQVEVSTVWSEEGAGLFAAHATGGAVAGGQYGRRDPAACGIGAETQGTAAGPGGRGAVSRV